jgi:DNA-binding ferritin-like protein
MNQKNKDVVKVLQSIRADEFILLNKTCFYKTNIEDKRFYQLEMLFGEQLEWILKGVECVSKLIRGMGERVVGFNLKEYEEYARISDGKRGDVPTDGDNIIKDLLGYHEKVVELLEKDTKNVMEKDPPTAEYIGRLIIQHREASWKLRAHLKGGKGDM